MGNIKLNIYSRRLWNRLLCIWGCSIMFMCSNIDDIKNIFKVINTLDAEAVLTFNEQGMVFNFMTRDTTTMVKLTYFKTNFNKYELVKPFKFKFLTAYLNEIMKQASKDDTLFFSFDESFANMKITITKKERKKTYELALLEPDIKEDIKIPQLSFTIKTSANNLELLDLLNSLIFIKLDKNSSDAIRLKASTDGIVIKEEDSERGKSTFTLKDFSKDGIKESVTCKFGGDLIKKIVTFSNSFSEKSIYEMSNNYPIKITTITPKLELICILAPRVDNE